MVVHKSLFIILLKITANPTHMHGSKYQITDLYSSLLYVKMNEFNIKEKKIPSDLHIYTTSPK